jgi:hypothetical protein
MKGCKKIKELLIDGAGFKEPIRVEKEDREEIKVAVSISCISTLDKKI